MWVLQQGVCNIYIGYRVSGFRTHCTLHTSSCYEQEGFGIQKLPSAGLYIVLTCTDTCCHMHSCYMHICRQADKCLVEGSRNDAWIEDSKDSYGRYVMLCCACREGQYLDATGGSFRAFMEGKLESFPGTQAMPLLLLMCLCVCHVKLGRLLI